MVHGTYIESFIGEFSRSQHVFIASFIVRIIPSASAAPSASPRRRFIMMLYFVGWLATIWKLHRRLHELRWLLLVTAWLAVGRKLLLHQIIRRHGHWNDFARSATGSMLEMLCHSAVFAGMISFIVEIERWENWRKRERISCFYTLRVARSVNLARASLRDCIYIHVRYLRCARVRGSSSPVNCFHVTVVNRIHQALKHWWVVYLPGIKRDMGTRSGSWDKK